MAYPFINKNLKDIISESGLKQRYIADKIGVSETMFSHQIAGRRKMIKEHRKILAKVLKIRYKDVNEIFKLQW